MMGNVNLHVTNTTDENNNGNRRSIGNLHNHNSVPGRARSKRSSRALGLVPSTHLAAPPVTTTWSSLPSPQLSALRHRLSRSHPSKPSREAAVEAMELRRKRARWEPEDLQ
ncbi:hypothetical protein ZOSMA_267G00350 [Zostera marina]|uniref:Uncharacterized protein n=1 Tax=Zostera marina TaxID=29655 RepID=A0A0K9PGX2_ZOSMR|nr:hypothetical protein ZOSMA_267G00350 [Zostera marina]